jgi:hypothetical protein
MPKVPSWEKEAGTGLHVSAFVDGDDAEHSSSSLIFFDRYFSQEVKQAGVDAARAPRNNGAD